MSENQKKSPVVAIVSILIIIGLIVTYASLLTGGSTSQTNQEQTPTSTQNNTISYSGKEGVDALTLLKESHTVDTSAEGFVNSIDGKKPADKQFWALYVNGVLGDKGAKDTITKSSDTLEWKLDSF